MFIIHGTCTSSILAQQIALLKFRKAVRDEMNYLLIIFFELSLFNP